MPFDVESLKILGSLVGIPAAGWLIKKQLAVNDRVAQHTAAIANLTDNIEHTRGRVDDIYNHLIIGEGPRKG